MFGLGKKKSAAPAAPSPRVIESLTDAEMSELDFLFMVDASGSMGFNQSTRMRGTLTDEVREDVIRMANAAEKYDSDGIDVVAFASGIETFEGVTATRVAQIFKEFPQGLTDLTAALQWCFDRAKRSKKNTVVIGYTDGSPNDPRSAMSVIDRAGRELGRPKIGFSIVQAGTDPGATAFLKSLDDDMEVDVTATFLSHEASSLTLHQLAWAALND